MRYLFEDKKDDDLCKLFRAAYPSSVSDSFDFLDGNGNLEHNTLEIMNNSDDIVFIFMDFVPANRNIKTIYNNLCRIGRKYRGRVIVLPIVCFEYYFICYLLKICFPVLRRDIIESCVRKEFYLNSDLMSDERSKSYVRNFERFCKVVLVNESVLISCLRKEIDKVKFFNVDCICDTALEKCQSLSLRDKAIGFLREFPCFPSGSYLNETVLNMEDIKLVHRQLIDEFNVWSDSFKAMDTGREKLYFNIQYMI